ncbi:MAG: DNA primase, partial [Planctomycetes bacterium]|nr:DNA primase [Planctomycetota bacterium]
MANPNRSNWWRHPGEVERLKASADLVGMIRGHGVDLKPEGADLVGLCPFHHETTPSFRVTPSKNLYHCFGCGKGGSAVDWLVATRGVSIREAFEVLRVSSGAVASQMGPSKDLVECAFEADPTWSDGRLLGVVADYYAARLAVSPVALEYLSKRGLNDPATIRRFRLGYADRTLGSALDRAPAGAALRARL